MQRISRRDNNSSLPQLNITNLVDVALTLVVILLIISPFIEQGIEVKLPSSSPAEIQIEKSIVITAAPDNVYYLESNRVTLREMYNILRDRSRDNKDISVIIKGDESVSYRNIIKVLDIAKKCEIEKIGLATQAE
ncbi:MAG TPA: biopolymer transporter ExbD [bacterium]|jgi:biopolymer transport protein ExbD|nr:biopolymer transporter ExbD [bacterium]